MRTLGLLGLLVWLSVVVVFFGTGIWAGVAFFNWLTALLVGSNMAAALATLLGLVGGFIVGVFVGKICAGIYTLLLSVLGVGVGLTLFGRKRP
jgi:hypothetical protein